MWKHEIVAQLPLEEQARKALLAHKNSILRIQPSPTKESNYKEAKKKKRKGSAKLHYV